MKEVALTEPPARIMFEAARRSVIRDVALQVEWRTGVPHAFVESFCNPSEVKMNRLTAEAGRIRARWNRSFAESRESWRQSREIWRQSREIWRQFCSAAKDAGLVLMMVVCMPFMLIDVLMEATQLSTLWSLLARRDVDAERALIRVENQRLKDQLEEETRLLRNQVEENQILRQVIEQMKLQAEEKELNQVEDNQMLRHVIEQMKLQAEEKEQQMAEVQNRVQYLEQELFTSRQDQDIHVHEQVASQLSLIIGDRV